MIDISICCSQAYPVPLFDLQPATQEQLHALYDMNGVKSEEMRDQVVYYPNRSMHIAHPWDLDCLIGAVLRCLQSEAFYLHIYDVPWDKLTLSTFFQPPILLPL